MAYAYCLPKEFLITMKNILINLYNDKLKNSFLLTGMLIFITAQTGNLCRFLLQMFLVRKLSPKEYSELEALLSLLLIGSSPVYILGPVVCKYISKYKALGDMLKIKTFILKALKTLSLCGIVVFLGIVLCTPKMQVFLKIDTAAPFYWVGFIIFLTFLYPATLGTIQGLQHFFYIGVDFSIPPILKMLLAMALLYLGLGINGVMASYAFAATLMISIPFIPLRKYLKVKGAPTKIEGKEILGYGLPIIISMQLFFVLIYIDTVLVKHLFENHDAAVYASMSMLGKIVLFLPVALFTVMLPKVSEKHTLGECTKHILFNTLKIVVSINIFLVTLFYFVPELLITILFKGKYMAGADILVYFAIAMAFFNLSITLMVYNMGRESNVFLIPFTLAAILQPTLIYMYHESIKQVIQLICINSFTLFVVSLILTLTVKHKPKAASK